MTREEKIRNLQNISAYVRKTTLETIINAENGHIGGNMSSVELMTTLYFGGSFKFDPEDSKHPNRDRVLVRGHLGPLRYTIFSILGYIDPLELSTYRKFGSRLQGHEDMDEVPGVDITPSGSLGMILSYGVGSAIANRDMKSTAKTIVFLGDGEEQEGNVSEAARHATTLGLNNLICIMDQNKKQLSRPTNESDGHSIKDIWSGYGWDVIEIKNGHDIDEILSVYERLQDIDRPTLVVANTTKGYGVKGAENHFCGYHTYHVVPDKQLIFDSYNDMKDSLAAKSLDAKKIKDLSLSMIKKPEKYNSIDINFDNSIFDIRNYESGINIEGAHDEYMKKLRDRIVNSEANPYIYIITPDLFRKDDVEMLGFSDFATFIDTGIREQHAIAMAHGISTENRNARIYIYYGDAFVYRALDQINVASTGNSNIMIVGENPGLYGARNGKTHQSVGQPGALSMITNLQLYEPADSVDLYNVLSNVLTNNNGVSYVRYHRGTIGLKRDEKDKNNIDAYFIYKSSDNPDIVIISSGVLCENAVRAAEELNFENGISVNVINIVSHKGFKHYADQLLTNNCPILTVYNGSSHVLPNDVMDAILSNENMAIPKTVKSLGFELGTSGSFDELVHYYHLDSLGIKNEALKMLDYIDQKENDKNGRQRQLCR